MYQILNASGDILSETEEPRYIKQRKNGVWHKCDKLDATHLAINGQRHDLNDVYINQIDAAEKIKSINLDNIRNATDIEELKAAAIDAYEAMYDIYQLIFSQNREQ